MKIKTEITEIKEGAHLPAAETGPRAVNCVAIPYSDLIWDYYYYYYYYYYTAAAVRVEKHLKWRNLI